MITNGSEPAYPTLEWRGDLGDYTMVSVGGLTKRELFAAMAMQGFLSLMASPEVLGSIAMGAKEAGVGTDQYVAEHAVAQADALLAALSAEESK